MFISGKFNVKMVPAESSIPSDHGITFGRFLLDKEYLGEISGKSAGEMVSGITPVKGSAGYVAIEQFTGNVSGKAGTMVLQHFGMMNAGTSRLILEVIPDSGTGDLTGISGTMQIRIEKGEHFYDFDYQFNDVK